MLEESTTPDLVGLWQEAVDAVDRRDFGAAMGSFAPDAVWEAQALGISFEGVAAIRGFFEDWRGDYEDYENEQEEGHNLGNGVVFAVNRLDGRPVGSSGRVQERWAFTVVWAAGMIVRVMARNDIDEARAAAERLAEERG